MGSRGIVPTAPRHPGDQTDGGDRPLHVPPLHIAVAFNLRTDDSEEQAERLHQDYIDDVSDALRSLGHKVTQAEVTGSPQEIFRRIRDIDPDLVFNLAEGTGGVWREALYPMLYDFLGTPYTFAGPGILGLGLDKRLTEEALGQRGVRVPRGRLVTPDAAELPDGLEYPLLIKPNYEGSSMGIHQDSVVDDIEEAQEIINKLLPDYPEGLNVEEFIEGRELTIGYLAESEPSLTKIVEYRFPGSKRNILDYETKMAGGDPGVITTICPAELRAEEEAAVRDVAARTFGAMRILDAGRIDVRLRPDGTPVVIEINALPGLRGISPLVTGAKGLGHRYADILGLIVKSAARRYGMLAEDTEHMVSGVTH